MSFDSKRKVKAVRKRHECFWCGCAIKIGQPAQYESWLYDGDFNDGYFHPECAAARDEYISIAHHCAAPGCFQDEAEYGEFEHARGRVDDLRLPPQFYPDGSQTDVPILEIEEESDDPELAGIPF